MAALPPPDETTFVSYKWLRAIEQTFPTAARLACRDLSRTRRSGAPCRAVRPLRSRYRRAIELGHLNEGKRER